MIDLRSDTITRPTPAMLEAMMQAQVGDDVFEEDPTIRRLEQKLARMFGKEAALYCPSGTMTNQIAIRILTQPQDEVICDKRSHIYNYEGGGIAYNSLISAKLLDGDRGRINPEMVVQNINPDDIHYPRTRLVALENTVNKGGGSIYPLKLIRGINQVCRENQLYLHLDGARLFNALAETGDKPSDIGPYFDTISICLSKGLGAPVGSVLICDQEKLKAAKRVRKVLGGGMRQAGYLAAAGIYALDHHLEGLKADHQRAYKIGNILSDQPYVTQVLPVETNIVIFSLQPDLYVMHFLNQLQEKGVKAVKFGPNEIRMVTHLEFDDNQLDQLEGILKSL
ncbi:MAG: threonine aldolase family protein [Candidatus Cyclobacteriaceae bacterium M3_2C_046]